MDPFERTPFLKDPLLQHQTTAVAIMVVMRRAGTDLRTSQRFLTTLYLVHQNRTIVIASDFRVDGVKSPEIRVFGLRNRSSKSQIASDFASHA